MKFKDYEVKTDKYGFEFVKDNIMKGKTKQRCMHCGELTEYIEVCSEGRICSDKCEKEWYKEYDKLVQGMMAYDG